MQDIDIVLGVIIFLLLCFIGMTIYFIITKDLKQEPCPECKPCPSLVFTLKQEPLVTFAIEPIVAKATNKRSCRYDQDTKNVFSTFYKHNCRKTPYVNVK